MSAHLAITAAAALAGLAALRRHSGSRQWLHGAPEERCAAIDESGHILASKTEQSYPTLESLIRGRDDILDRAQALERSGADQYLVEEFLENEIARVENLSLTPMKGFAYAALTGEVGERHLKFKSWRGDCLYEVELAPGALVVPDEDWIGKLLVNRVNSRLAEVWRFNGDDVLPRSGSAGDAEFLAWWDRMAEIVPEYGLWYTRESELIEEALDEWYLDGNGAVELFAAAGRDLVSHLIGRPKGRAWLVEGAMRFAPSIAHEGPMKIIRRIH